MNTTGTIHTLGNTLQDKIYNNTCTDWLCWHSHLESRWGHSMTFCMKGKERAHAHMHTECTRTPIYTHICIHTHSYGTDIHAYRHVCTYKHTALTHLMCAHTCTHMQCIHTMMHTYLPILRTLSSEIVPFLTSCLTDIVDSVTMWQSTQRGRAHTFTYTHVHTTCIHVQIWTCIYTH